MKQHASRLCDETGAAGGVRPSSMGRNLFFEKLLKLLQLFRANVGNSPVVEVRVDPVQKLITLARQCLRGFRRVGGCRPNKEINEMFAPLVNQGSHRSILKIIETAAN